MSNLTASDAASARRPDSLTTALLLCLTLLACAACGTSAPLLVQSASPPDGTELPAARPMIELQFDRALDPRTVGFASIALSQGDEPIAVEVSLLPGGTVLRAQPAADLKPGVPLELKLGKSVRGIDGEKTGAAWAMSYPVGAAPAVAAPAHPTNPTMEGGNFRLTGAKLTPIQSRPKTD